MPTRASVDTDLVNNVELSRTEHARLLGKLDRNLLPLVSLLYLLSFIDRTNVGSAKVRGMVADLELKFYIAAAVFFVLYSLAQVPSHIILKLFRRGFVCLIRLVSVVPTSVVAWGLVTMLMSLVNTYQGLLANDYLPM